MTDRFAVARAALTASARQTRAEDDENRRLPVVTDLRVRRPTVSILPDSSYHR